MRPALTLPPFLGTCLVGTCLLGISSGCGLVTPRWGDRQPVYPEPSPRGSTLDVQVVRDETEIRLTNTTARSFPAGRLWVNQWFSREVPEFEVGASWSYSLYGFRDEHGEVFRAGGFFASEQPEVVVTVELDTLDPSGSRIIHPFVVVREGE
ncbi:MAG: hypothetical protein AAF108_10125 [Planctomycetota bacterium]